MKQKENKMPGFHVHKTKSSKAFPKPQFYYVFHAKNGQVLNTSETYTTKQSCVKGIKSVLNVLQATDHRLYYDHTGKEVNLYCFDY